MPNEALASPSTRAISKSDEPPVPAAHKLFFIPTGLDLKVSAGYILTNSGMPSGSRLNLNGADVSLIADLAPHFGVIADSSYVRAGNAFGTTHCADILSYLIGPTFYPLIYRKTRAYVSGLAGGARVTGPFSANGVGIVTGYVNDVSWVVGGGVEYQLSPSFMLRSGADYQYTRFFNSTEVIQGRHGFRAVCSIEFSAWRHPRARY